jgi:hypothetical protein
MDEQLRRRNKAAVSIDGGLEFVHLLKAYLQIVAPVSRPAVLAAS